LIDGTILYSHTYDYMEYDKVSMGLVTTGSYTRKDEHRKLLSRQLTFLEKT
jgi:hypothetical protein